MRGEGFRCDNCGYMEILAPHSRVVSWVSVSVSTGTTAPRERFEFCSWRCLGEAAFERHGGVTS